MCYKGKCLHCLEVETGAFIYAILNLMFTSVGSVVSIGALLYTNFVYHEAMIRADLEQDEEMMSGALIFGLAANIIIPIFIVTFCISFAFAVLLIVGLCKRNHNYVKAFYIYGVVKTVLSITGAILMVVGQSDGLPGVVVLITSVIFVMILVMIRMTYKKFENEVKYNSFTNPINVVAKF